MPIYLPSGCSLQIKLLVLNKIPPYYMVAEPSMSIYFFKRLFIAKQGFYDFQKGHAPVCKQAYLRKNSFYRKKKLRYQCRCRVIHPNSPHILVQDGLKAVFSRFFHSYLTYKPLCLSPFYRTGRDAYPKRTLSFRQ